MHKNSICRDSSDNQSSSCLSCSGIGAAASWVQGGISPHRVVLHNYGHYGIFMLSFKASSLASGGDRIQGWKFYWSVQLKQVLCPNTKLMVLSLRLHEAKLPALGIPTGRAKVGLKTHSFPMLLDGAHPQPPPRLTDSPTPVQSPQTVWCNTFMLDPDGLQFGVPMPEGSLSLLCQGFQIHKSLQHQLQCRWVAGTSNLTVRPLQQHLLLTKALPVRLGRNRCLKNCISGFTQRFLLIVWNNTSFIIQRARQSHSSSLDDTFYLQTPKLTHSHPVNPSGSFLPHQGHVFLAHIQNCVGGWKKCLLP